MLEKLKKIEKTDVKYYLSLKVKFERDWLLKELSRNKVRINFIIIYALASS